MTRDPITVEVMAGAGFSWLALDLEHAPIDLGSAADLLRVGTLAGTPMLVRMPGHDSMLAKRLADAGASGFIFPDVRSADAARELVRMLRYPDVRGGSGQRGVGLGRASAYGRQFESYFHGWNDALTIVAQIEHRDAVNEVEEIAACEGIDALLVGPYDLSASMGLSGKIDHPEVMQSLDRVVTAAGAAGKAAGFHVVPADIPSALDRLRAGARFLAFSADVFILRDVCDSFLRAAREEGLAQGKQH